MLPTGARMQRAEDLVEYNDVSKPCPSSGLSILCGHDKKKTLKAVDTIGNCPKTSLLTWCITILCIK